MSRLHEKNGGVDCESKGDELLNTSFIPSSFGSLEVDLSNDGLDNENENSLMELLQSHQMGGLNDDNTLSNILHEMTEKGGADQDNTWTNLLQELMEGGGDPVVSPSSSLPITDATKDIKNDTNGAPLMTAINETEVTLGAFFDNSETWGLNDNGHDYDDVSLWEQCIKDDELDFENNKENQTNNVARVPKSRQTSSKQLRKIKREEGKQTTLSQNADGKIVVVGASSKSTASFQVNRYII
jgi:hypothetical protein